MENTTKFSNIEEVSTVFNLDITETTTGVNGYPKQLKQVLTGFNSISECIMIKEVLETEGHLVTELKLHRKDGWSLWERSNCPIRSGMYMTISQNNWTIDVGINDDEKQVAFNLICGGREFENLDDMTYYMDITVDFANELYHILSDLEYAGVNSGRVFYNPDNDYNIDYFTHDESVGYSFDTHTYQIGLMVEFKEEDYEG